MAPERTASNLSEAMTEVARAIDLRGQSRSGKTPLSEVLRSTSAEIKRCRSQARSADRAEAPGDACVT